MIKLILGVNNEREYVGGFGFFEILIVVLKVLKFLCDILVKVYFFISGFIFRKKIWNDINKRF